MANKTRRRRGGASADPNEIKARTGVAPAPGEVVSKKTKAVLDTNKARAKTLGADGLAELERGNYAGAGLLFHEAAQSANLANAAKLKGAT